MKAVITTIPHQYYSNSNRKWKVDTDWLFYIYSIEQVEDKIHPYRVTGKYQPITTTGKSQSMRHEITFAYDKTDMEQRGLIKYIKP